MKRVWLIPVVLAAVLLAGSAEAGSAKARQAEIQKSVKDNASAKTETLSGGEAVSAAGLTWHTSLAAAQAEAKKTNRPILVLGTGSDWCGFCMRLEKNVLTDKEFQKFAKDSLVLVYADKPSRKKQSAEVAKNSQELLDKFDVDGFPTVILLSPDGKELGRKAGYGGQNAKKYVKELKGILKK